jgi:hypothetical protein
VAHCSSWHCRGVHSAYDRTNQTDPSWRYLNADETCSILNANGFYTWAPRGCENVQKWIDGNEKESYPVMATVASDGWALPLQLTVRGKTRRRLSQLRGIEPDVAQYGEKGWQTAVPLGHYLRWLRRRPRYGDGRRIVLLPDSYAAHKCGELREIAETLKTVILTRKQISPKYVPRPLLRGRGDTSLGRRSERLAPVAVDRDLGLHEGIDRPSDGGPATLSSGFHRSSSLYRGSLGKRGEMRFSRWCAILGQTPLRKAKSYRQTALLGDESRETTKIRRWRSLFGRARGSGGGSHIWDSNVMPSAGK